MTLTTKSLPVSIAVSDAGLRQRSQSALHALPASTVTLYEMPETGASLIAAVETAQPAVLVADLAALGPSFGEVIRKLRTQLSPPDILVLHHAADGGTILKAMRAGAREFFFEEIETSLQESIRGIALENQSEETTGKLYAFLSAKGGCGATTLASYAAASLARGSQSKVLFADMNFGSPSAAFLFRAVSKYSLQDAAEEINRMDRALWKAMVTGTSHGFDLAPPPAPQAISPERLRALLHFCKTQYGNLVVDCGNGINPLTPALLDATDEIVLVTSTDVLALYHAKRMLSTIQELTGASRVRLVLNRVRRRPDLGQGEIESMLGHPIFASVPNDYRALTQACEQGALLSPEHLVAQSIGALMGQMAGATATRKRKLFGLFGN